MPVAIDTISPMELFEDLKTAELAQIAAAMELLHISEGESLTYRGNTADMFYIVLSGMFMIAYQNERALTLNQKGDLIGWSTFVDPFRYTGTTTALTEGEVLAIAGPDLMAVMDRNPEAKSKIMARISASSALRQALSATN